MRIRNNPDRRGFTLLELLVVMSIIALIAGLSIGVFFRVRQTQTEGATVTIVNKLQSQLDQQWKAVLDNARDDAKADKINNPPNSNVSTFAGSKSGACIGGGDSRRELVIWTKMQLKLEFPTTFWEAIIWPNSLPNGTGLPTATNPQTNSQIFGKSAYVKAILGTAQIPVAQINNNPSPQADQALQESAVLFYLAMTQGRRGVAAFNPIDHLGPHAIGEVTLAQYTKPNGTNPTFKVFVDTWGQPISFIRWPTAMPIGQAGNPADEINAPPYATYGTISTYNNGQPFVVDPQDPENTLFLNWNANLQGQFKQFIHTLGNVPVNLSPIIMSAGRDKVTNTINGASYVHYGVNTDFSLIDSSQDDNIYGYRSRGVGRH